MSASPGTGREKVPSANVAVLPQPPPPVSPLLITPPSQAHGDRPSPPGNPASAPVPLGITHLL